MENLDIIILTLSVVVAFIIFIFTSVKEFIKMEDEDYEFKKASGFTRAALFNVLSSLFEDDEVPEKTKEKYKNTIERTISDMHTNGMYFDKKLKKALKQKKKEKKEGKKKQ